MSLLNATGWRSKLQSFRREQGGNILIVFGLSAFFLMLTAGGAIEFHRRGVAKQELQNAVDTAALAGKQRQIALSSKIGAGGAMAQGTNYARDMFTQQIKLSKSFPSTPNANYIWNADGSFTVQTNSNYEVLFGNIFPSNFSALDVTATVDFANSVPTEVALVLDTTMSMFNKDGRPETRFTLMRNAAKKFTHQIFNAAQATGDQNLVRVSVVPWATTVNVLGAAPAAADFTGDAPVVSIPDWGSRVAVSSPTSRLASVTGTSGSRFQPVEWRGCVSGATEAPTTYDDAAVATWEALQTPAAPAYEITVSEGPVTTKNVTVCTCDSWQDVPCGPPPPGTQGFHKMIEKAVPQIRNARFLLDKDIGQEGRTKTEKAQCSSCVSSTCGVVPKTEPDCTVPTSTRMVPYCSYYSDNGRRNSYTPQAFSCTSAWDGCYETGKGPTANETAPACVGDPNEPGIYNNTVTWCSHLYDPNAKVWDSPKPVVGPNMNCVSPMLGLSGNRNQVVEYIDRLTPVPGGTHADVGLRWALRTLSPMPAWMSFFGVTRAPGAYGPSAQKVMVIITDGQNEQAKEFPGYWGCSDASRFGCFTSPDQTELDSRMQGWCNAIRTNYNITIYAVAVNFTNAAAVTQLQNCTGNPANVFNVDAADLTAVLSGIASRVMAMRLVK